MTDPWGLEDPPAVDPAQISPLPPRLAELAAPDGPRPRRDGDDWPDPRELPEVQALQAAGWQPLDPAPLLRCLPALWPRELRCWVPDRLPRVTVEQRGTGRVLHPPVITPRTPEQEAVAQEHADHCARFAGLPPAPRGRIWLLRSPWPDVLPLPLLLLALQQVAEEGVRQEPERDPVAVVAARLLADTSAAGAARVLDEWHGDSADAAAARRRTLRRPTRWVELAMAGVGPAVSSRCASSRSVRG